jgi:hypothetical protein
MADATSLHGVFCSIYTLATCGKAVQGILREQLWSCVNLVTAPLISFGLWFYFVGEETRGYGFAA